MLIGTGPFPQVIVSAHDTAFRMSCHFFRVWHACAAASLPRGERGVSKGKGCGTCLQVFWGYRLRGAKTGAPRPCPREGQRPLALLRKGSLPNGRDFSEGPVRFRSPGAGSRQPACRDSERDQRSSTKLSPLAKRAMIRGHECLNLSISQTRRQLPRRTQRSPAVGVFEQI